MTTLRTLSAVIVLSAAAQAAGAQLPNASAAAYGMAGNYTAAATGYDAVAWNPANLGLSTPKFSLNLLALSGSTGLDPVKFNDISAFGGKVIPAATKEAWLQQIGSGTERGSVDAGISLVALSVGRLGFQIGASGAGEANLNQDAAEALLFGNAGRTGTPKDLRLNGSSAGGSSFVTGAVSLGLPISWQPMGEPDEQFSIGVTGKYVVGAAVARAKDNGSLITPDNVQVQFPTIYSPDYTSGNAGSGVGVDVGVAWSARGTTISATARNVVNTFAWSPENLKTRLGTASFNGTTSSSSFNEAPYSAAPAAMRADLEAEKFKPEFAIGIAKRMSSLTLTADGGQRIGDGIQIGPKMHVGVGAEYTGIPILSLRGGAAAITDGFQAAGGLGLRLGPVEVGAALSTRSRNSGTEFGFMLSLISIH